MSESRKVREGDKYWRWEISDQRQVKSRKANKDQIFKA
jgi:hypothetical protein